MVIKTWKGKRLKETLLALDEPPEGLSLSGVSVVPQGLAFNLSADKDAAKSGYAGNLIVEAFRESAPKRKDGKVGRKRRYSIGYLPAIPVRVVQR